ncbi:hypothetical protein [Rheinheimera sp.]|uniref:hypothetical protein n=1 Tax=Rheinheimera sp. TaxID=1869214 RepID=UPI004048591F
MKSILLIIAILATVLGFAYLEQYQIANMPDDLKSQYYAEKFESQKSEAAAQQETKIQFDSMTNKKWNELSDGEHIMWLYHHSALTLQGHYFLLS